MIVSTDVQEPVVAPARQRLTLLAMCVATFMIQLDVTVVNVALPRIQADLGVGPGALEWVISAYALSLAALIPVGGALGDRYGRKRIFLVGLAIFAVGSTACAVSTTGTALIASRAVQGIGGAGMLALTLSIITEAFPTPRRAGAIGTWAAVGGTGFGVGPVAGGVLLRSFGWASVFWVNVPVAIIGIGLTVVAVAESRNEQSRRLDHVGVALSAAGLFAVTLGFVESASHPWRSWPVIASLVVGVACLAGFGLWQQHTSHPMVPPSLIRARSFVSAAGIYLVSYAAFSGALFYVTLMYQDAAGWSVLRTGLSWLFMNIPFLCLAQLTSRLHRRLSSTTVICLGCLTAAAGLLALSLARPSTSFVLAAAGFVLSGIGFGALTPGVAHLAMRDVTPGSSGVASGVLNAARQLGTSVGLAILATLGVRTAVSAWNTRITGFPPSIRDAAQHQAQNVGGARIAAVTRTLGGTYRHPATQSFLAGYHLALGAGVVCLVIAALVAAVGFRSSE